MVFPLFSSSYFFKKKYIRLTIIVPTNKTKIPNNSKYKPKTAIALMSPPIGLHTIIAGISIIKNQIKTIYC